MRCLKKNQSEHTSLIQRAGVLLCPPRRFPGGCCSCSPVPRSPPATSVQAGCCSMRAAGKGCPRSHGVSHAPATARFAKAIRFSQHFPCLLCSGRMLSVSPRQFPGCRSAGQGQRASAAQFPETAPAKVAIAKPEAKASKFQTSPRLLSFFSAGSPRTTFLLH